MNKTLILYYTKYQTTLTTAMKIKQSLPIDCDVFSVKELKSISNDYSIVILGTPIFMGSIPKEFIQFCENNKQILMQKKIYLYIHGLVSKKEYLDIVQRSLDKNLVSKFIAIDFFGGKLDYQKMNFLLRFIFKKMAKSLGLESDNPNTVSDEKIDQFILKIK